MTPHRTPPRSSRGRLLAARAAVAVVALASVGGPAPAGAATVTEAGAAIEVGDLPVVPGDDGELRRLFQNLLENALKFSRTDAPPWPSSPWPPSPRPPRRTPPR
jgi:signal transduction histidine kinase